MDVAGNVVDSLYGAGTSTTQITNHAAYDPNSSYLMYMKSTSGSTTYQDLAYQWYVIGNLYNRASNPTSDNPNTLSETFGYDLHNRLLSSTVTNSAGAQPALTQAYDSVGDIMCKSDVVGSACTVGSTGYTYGGTAGPHAVTAAGANTYTYDADGNMTSRSVTVNGTASSQTMSWNSDNMPTAINQDASNYSNFSYAPDKHRYKQVAMNAGSSETTLYVGGLDIITDSSGTWYRHTISAYGKPVMLETLSSNTSGVPKEDKHYLLPDHLGSVDTVVSDDGSGVKPRESFDAFGQRRDQNTWVGPMNSTDLANARKVTHRGFTHHEHLDNLAGLVHANGRVLDSVTGRFLSVDPMYQAPTNSQSINPYSYVMNNSLSLADPSGYSACMAGDLCLSGGEHDRDSKGNLIKDDSNVLIKDMKPGQEYKAGGETLEKDADGNVYATTGNGADISQAQNAVTQMKAMGDPALIGQPANRDSQSAVDLSACQTSVSCQGVGDAAMSGDGKHQYDMMNTICTSGTPSCDHNDVYQSSLKNAYPGSDSIKPVKNLGQYMMVMSTGSITTFVEPQLSRVINYTNDDHILYQGLVIRSTVETGNVISIRTFGEGVNDPKLWWMPAAVSRALNMAVYRPIWNTMDNRVRNDILNRSPQGRQELQSDQLKQDVQSINSMPPQF